MQLEKPPMENDDAFLVRDFQFDLAIEQKYPKSMKTKEDMKIKEKKNTTPIHKQR